MPWHDETPWAARRRKEDDAKRVIDEQFDAIELIVRRVKSGEMSQRKALQQIEEIASSGTDRIVRVGSVHTPDIQAAQEKNDVSDR